jgi:hypothetical protein
MCRFVRVANSLDVGGLQNARTTREHKSDPLLVPTPHHLQRPIASSERIRHKDVKKLSGSASLKGNALVDSPNPTFMLSIPLRKEDGGLA